MYHNKDAILTSAARRKKAQIIILPNRGRLILCRLSCYECKVVQLIRTLSFYKSVPFSALTLLVGRQEGHLGCKKLGIGFWVVTIFDWSFVRLIAQLSPLLPSSLAAI